MKHRTVIDPKNPCKESVKFLLRTGLLILMTLLFGGCVGDYVRPTPPQGYYYTIKKGDTLYRIAADHKVGLQELAELNGIENTASIREGLVLFIPGIAPEGELRRVEDHRDIQNKGLNQADRDAKQADTGQDKIKSGPSVMASSSPTIKRKQENLGKTGETAKRKDTVKKAEVPGKGKIAVKKDLERPEKKESVPVETRKEEGNQKGKFMWPAKGKVISNYGPQPNGMFYNGIRIEIRKETAVNAASAGSVIFSAFLKDYGETLIIKHDNDYATVYTHLTKRLVKVDQIVKRGESIALVVPSPTGTSFFDFEIRYRNKAKNPLLFL